MATQDSGGFKDSGFDFSNFLDEDDEILEPEQEVHSDPAPSNPLEVRREEPAAVAPEEPAGFTPVETELTGLFPDGKPVAKSPDEITTGGLELDLKEAYEGYLTGGKMSWGNKRQAKKHFEEALRLEEALRDADKAILARAGGYASIIANLSDEKLLLEEKSFLKGDEEDYYSDEEVETSESALASRAAQIQSTDLYKELERLENHRSSINSKRIAALEGLRDATSNEDNKYWQGLSTAISDRLKGIADVQDVTKSKVSLEDEEVFEKGVEEFESYMSGNFDPLSESDEDEDAEFEPYGATSEEDPEDNSKPSYLNQQEEDYPEDESDSFPQWEPEPEIALDEIHTQESPVISEEESFDGLEPASSLFTDSRTDFTSESFFDDETAEAEELNYEEESEPESAAAVEEDFELVEPESSVAADLSPEESEDEAYGHDGPTLAEAPFWDDSAPVEEEESISESEVSSDQPEAEQDADEDFESDPWGSEDKADEADFESDPWGEDELEEADETAEAEEQEVAVDEFSPVSALEVRERHEEQASFIVPVSDREPVRAVIFEELKAKHKIDFD